MPREGGKYSVQTFAEQFDGMGARAGDILVAPPTSTNKGFRIRISKDQKKRVPPTGDVTWNIIGKFEILNAGEGDYSKYLEEFVGKTLYATRLIEEVRQLQLKREAIGYDPERNHPDLDGYYPRRESVFSYAVKSADLRIECPQCQELLEHIDNCNKCGWSRAPETDA